MAMKIPRLSTRFMIGFLLGDFDYVSPAFVGSVDLQIM
jgi:hypothetical protein